MRSRAAALLWSVLAESCTILGGAVGLALAPRLGTGWVLYPLAVAGGCFFFLGFHAIHEEWKRRGALPAFHARGNRRRWRRRFATGSPCAIPLASLALFAAMLYAAAPSTGPVVEIELMTYPEIYAAIHQQGKTTVLIYNGGTEQRGPHAVLGGHTIMARATAAEIARRLGNALVAPVLPFSPAGGHLQAAMAGQRRPSRATSTPRSTRPSSPARSPTASRISSSSAITAAARKIWKNWRIA